MPSVKAAGLLNTHMLGTAVRTPACLRVSATLSAHKCFQSQELKLQLAGLITSKMTQAAWMQRAMSVRVQRLPESKPQVSDTVVWSEVLRRCGRPESANQLANSPHRQWQWQRAMAGCQACGHAQARAGDRVHLRAGVMRLRIKWRQYLARKLQCHQATAGQCRHRHALNDPSGDRCC